MTGSVCALIGVCLQTSYFTVIIHGSRRHGNSAQVIIMPTQIFSVNKHSSSSNYCTYTNEHMTTPIFQLPRRDALLLTDMGSNNSIRRLCGVISSQQGPQKPTGFPSTEHCAWYNTCGDEALGEMFSPTMASRRQTSADWGTSI